MSSNQNQDCYNCFLFVLPHLLPPLPSPNTFSTKRPEWSFEEQDVYSHSPAQDPHYLSTAPLPSPCIEIQILMSHRAPEQISNHISSHCPLLTWQCHTALCVLPDIPEGCTCLRFSTVTRPSQVLLTYLGDLPPDGHVALFLTSPHSIQASTQKCPPKRPLPSSTCLKWLPTLVCSHSSFHTTWCTYSPVCFRTGRFPPASSFSPSSSHSILPRTVPRP